MFDDDDEIDQCAGLLEAADPDVRRVAARRLAEWPDAAAAALLLGLLADPAETVRLEAVLALESQDGAGVATGLIEALSDPAPAVRDAAALTLAEWRGASGAIDRLVGGLGHETALVRAACFRALREQRTAAAKAPADAALTDADAAVRREALLVLGYLKAQDCVPAMARTAADADPEVRRAAMEALVISPDRGPGVAALMQGLHDADWQVREAAAASLGKVAAPQSRAALRAAMDDPAWQVRVKVADALGKHKDAAGIAALGNALSHSVSNLRKQAAASLGEIGHRDALIWLEPAADDADPDVRKIVRWAMDRCEKAGGLCPLDPR